MSRPVRLLALAALPFGAAALVACGSLAVQVPKGNEYRDGAELFAQRCAGCHTLEPAGAEGSAARLGENERTDGPSFDQRKERSVQEVLFAIRNGGFSGAIMPQNIVVGAEAEKVAEFLVACSGKKAKQPKAPGTPPPSPPLTKSKQTGPPGNPPPSPPLERSDQPEVPGTQAPPPPRRSDCGE
ncbi:MAG: c-type cytochrome [Solirubrobacteraceae bacterium]